MAHHKTAFEPLRVTFEISGGWASPTFPVHLDALLAYVVTMRSIEDLYDEEPSIQALRELGEDLPLERFEQDGQWVWKASAIMPAGPVLNDSAFYTQRRDLVDYAKRFGNGTLQHGRTAVGKEALKPYALALHTARGVHRNLLGYYPIQRAFNAGVLTLQAWCIGDHERLVELLTDNRRPTHLGARRRSGFGRINSVYVDRDSSAQTQWQLRVKPWPLREDDVPIQAACKAPYWAAENRGLAYIPKEL